MSTHSGNTSFIGVCSLLGIHWGMGQETLSANATYYSQPTNARLVRAVHTVLMTCINNERASLSHQFSCALTQSGASLMMLIWVCNTDSLDKILERALVNGTDIPWTVTFMNAVNETLIGREFKLKSRPVCPTPPSVQAVDPKLTILEGDYSPSLVAEELVRAIKLAQWCSKPMDDPYTRALIGKLVQMYFSTDHNHTVPSGESYVHTPLTKVRQDSKMETSHPRYSEVEKKDFLAHK